MPIVDDADLRRGLRLVREPDADRRRLPAGRRRHLPGRLRRPADGADLRRRRFRLVGDTSYGNGCAEPGYPGIYGRVADTTLRTWISSVAPEAVAGATTTTSTTTTKGKGARRSGSSTAGAARPACASPPRGADPATCSASLSHARWRSSRRRRVAVVDREQRRARRGGTTGEVRQARADRRRARCRGRPPSRRRPSRRLGADDVGGQQADDRLVLHPRERGRRPDPLGERVAPASVSR